MVRAVAKTGPRTGQPLWRCSDFDCPTLINIEEGDVTPPTPIAGGSAQTQYERERAAFTERLQRASMLLAALGVLVAAGAFFLAAIFADLRIAALIASFIVLAFVWALFRSLPSEVIYWGNGAEGERRVGAKLESLEPLGFVTLYDRRIPGRGGNIDAVTVGPPGVFVVETKWRRRGVQVIQGRFEVGGREQADTVRQVTEQAMLVQVTAAQAMKSSPAHSRPDHLHREPDRGRGGPRRRDPGPRRQVDRQEASQRTTSPGPCRGSRTRTDP
jgi:hypothetical protein